MKTLNARTLLETQICNKIDLEELDNHHDVLNVNATMCIVYLSQLLPLLTLQSLDKKSLKPEKVFSACTLVLEHMLLLCEGCNYDVPEEQDIEGYESEMSPEVKFDSILTVTDMIGAVSDLIHVINVDAKGEIWDMEDVPLDFEADILAIIVGIKNLGRKFNFTIDDILAELV